MTAGRQERRVLGRYLLADAFASGGMATIHLGRLLGPVGFARTVAIKRLHPQYAKDPAFVASFLDEARLAAKVQHPNVGATLDVVATEGELFLVMEYVDGESLSHLLRRVRKRDELIPPAIVSAIVTGALYGLHAAHEARGDDDEPLELVHRDFSPQNILVGVDGNARVVDFGIAKAAQRVQETEVGRIKGKFGYMSPEQVQGRPLDRRTDVFAAGAVLWEALTSKRLFEDDDPMRIMTRVMEAKVARPSSIVPGLPPALDDVCLRALEQNREARFATAREMAMALELAAPPALTREVGEWVSQVVGDVLARRARALSRLSREGSEPSPIATREELARVLDSADETVDYPPAGSAPLPEPETKTTLPLVAAPAAESLLPERQAVDESVASWNAAPRPAKSTYALAGAMTGVVVFVAVLIAVGIAKNRQPDVQPVASSAVEAPLDALSSASTSTPREPVGASDAPAARAPVGDEDAAAGAAPSVRDGGRRPPPPRSCVPPYWVDAEGIKKYKPWCLGAR